MHYSMTEIHVEKRLWSINIATFDGLVYKRLLQHVSWLGCLILLSQDMLVFNENKHMIVDVMFGWKCNNVWHGAVSRGTPKRACGDEGCVMENHNHAWTYWENGGNPGCKWKHRRQCDDYG